MVDRDAYDACLRLARRHYENFPVASWIVPRDARRHIAAIYAFARLADDFADEGRRTAAERLGLLDDWSRRLAVAVRGHTGPGREDADVVFRALQQTIHACRLEPALFEDLLSAFRQDVTTSRYASWPTLLDYCRRSANPVGRLVLRVFGYRDAQLDRESDAICTALQLTNFWQDLARDWQKGRVYVPADLLASAGADLADLTRGTLGPAWRNVLRDVGARTRALFDQGRPLSRRLAGRLAWEVRATWLGGVRVLDRLERIDFDVVHHRPSIGWRDGLFIASQLLRGR